MRGLPCSASFAELASFHFGENEVSALFLLASQSCRDAPGGSVGDGPLHPGKKGVTRTLAVSSTNCRTGNNFIVLPFRVLVLGMKEVMTPKICLTLRFEADPNPRP